MKKTKVLLTLACAVLLVAASVMGTLAYLTSTDTVTNTFTVGNVAITLDEAKVNANGQPIDKDGNVVEELANAERVESNSYNLIPGHTYTKDPTIHVADDSEDCYLFVKVENGISGIEATTTDPNNPTSIDDQMLFLGWQPLGPSYDDIYVYGTKDGEGPDSKIEPKVVTASNSATDVTVFNTITVKEKVNNAELAKYADKTVTVTAYAIQKDGFEGKTAAEIWNTISGIYNSSNNDKEG